MSKLKITIYILCIVIVVTLYIISAMPLSKKDIAQCDGMEYRLKDAIIDYNISHMEFKYCSPRSSLLGNARPDIVVLVSEDVDYKNDVLCILVKSLELESLSLINNDIMKVKSNMTKPSIQRIDYAHPKPINKIKNKNCK